MDQQKFDERDHLAWNRFMFLNLALAGLADARQRDGDADEYVASLRRRLSRAWAGLGAQGVEGAMLSMILTLESIGCQIRSTQTSPENSEIIVEPLPGSRMRDGMLERFEVGLEPDAWYALFDADPEMANQIYDILGAIADGAEVEYVREATEDGDVRLILRAW